MLNYYNPTSMTLPEDYTWEPEFDHPAMNRAGTALMNPMKVRGMGYAYKQALKRIKELEIQCGRHGTSENLGLDTDKSVA